MSNRAVCRAAPLLLIASCTHLQPPAHTFGDDLAFLRRHVEVIVLDRGTELIAVVPEYQGRVMTSSCEGTAGSSFGWIHRAAIARGERQPHMNVFGGEERFWLGPEGGQFSLYFAPGDPFDLDHWQVPTAIDWGRWSMSERTDERVSFTADCVLTNWSGFEFSMRIERSVVLEQRQAVASVFGLPLPEEVAAVGYRTDNQVTNTGSRPWRKETGLVSIGLLGMFPPRPNVTVVVPLRSVEGDGPLVQDAYFGVVPQDRLVVDRSRRVVFFKGDGLVRSKIGLPPGRAGEFLGSWDPDAGVLTLVRTTVPEGALEYVNSQWMIQEAPFAGDVLNSYNDGPPAPGVAPLGPFYELESSSPALALAPGATGRHRQWTWHFTGAREGLDRLATAVLGTGLQAIESAFR